uniref:Uncharacterized protein n=1 Tax=Avena sativa TaxID=4498 RepID=A0ACD5WA50_AVESA
MGFAIVFRVLFLSAAALLGSFAIAVSLSDSARAIYEDYIEHWMEAAEFIFTWIGSFYNILPMVAFITIQDWAKVFFDCFTPISLWLEVLYSTIFLVHLLVFVGGLESNYGRIIMEFGGLGIQLVAIIGYVLQKLAYDDHYAKNEAKHQFLWALAFFKVSGLAILIQIQFKIIAPEGQGYWRIALGLAVFGVLFQFLQIVISIYYRSIEDNFKDDPTNIRRVKLGAALIKVVTMSYDCWLFYARGYWQSPEKRMLAIMTVCSLLLTCTVALGRDVGPEKLRKVYLDCVEAEGTKAVFGALSACFGAMKTVCGAVRTGVAILVNWLLGCVHSVLLILKGVYLADKIEQDTRRRAEQEEAADPSA